MKKLYLLALIACCFSRNALSQGELPVDMYTGTPDISINLFRLQSYQLQDDITLKHNTHGVKVAQASGLFGTNWSLKTSGIQREVRGLPDDWSGGNSDGRRGWLYDNIAYTVGAFGNTADTSAQTCADELSDFTAIQSLNSTYSLKDSEPDLFSYQVGDISGKFVFDNTTATPEIRLIPYRDITIEPVFISGENKEIAAFKIRTNNGLVYTFDVTDTETRYTSGDFPSEVVRKILKRDYLLYYSDVYPTKPKYNTAWSLSKVEAPSGDKIQYYYTSHDYTTNVPVTVSIRKPVGESGFSTYSSYTTYLSGTKYDLTSIHTAAGPGVKIVTTGDIVTAIELWDKRLNGDLLFGKLVKKVSLTYTSGPRRFLTALQESATGETMPPYKFEYKQYYNLPGDFVATGQDFWGYYTGRTNSDLIPALHVYPQLPIRERYRVYQIPNYAGEHYTLAGADRTPNPVTVDYGSLSKIEYPWGGETNIEYELNQYYDFTAQQSYYGGGLRIKSATYKDGLNPDIKIYKNFVYTDSLGKSSGRLMAAPAFAIPLYEYHNGSYVYSYEGLDGLQQTIWELFTARTDKSLNYDESTWGNNVGYAEVKVLRPGAGSSRYEYAVPGFFGAPASGNWIPTINKFARSSACNSPGIVDKVGTFSFPYAPNPEFDFERGLVLRKRDYNENSILVQDTKTSYQYIYKQGSEPRKVWGIRYENYPNDEETIWFYGKYLLLTDVIKVPYTETNTAFDPASARRLVERSVYDYQSTAHKLITRARKIGADGTVYTNVFKYPLDYGVIPAGADKMASMITLLQASNQNSIPVEQYSIVKRSGGIGKVVAGGITLYNDFGIAGKALPQYQLAFRSTAGVDTAAFIPSYINSTPQAFKVDSHYDTVQTISAYDSADQVVTVASENLIPQTNLWSSKLAMPVASIQNATLNQFAFSDFEVGTEASFNIVNDSPDMPELAFGSGKTGERGIWPEIKLSKVLSRGGDYYKVAGWWNEFITAMSMRIKIQNALRTVTYLDQTFSLTPDQDPSIWQFFEKDVPVDAALSEFYVEITFAIQGGTSGNDSGLGQLDDVVFLPVNAQLTSYTYTLPFGISSVSSGDKINYTVYDSLGRVKYLLDTDKSIIQRKTYRFNSN